MTDYSNDPLVVAVRNFYQDKPIERLYVKFVNAIFDYRSEGMSFGEIAKEMDMPHGLIKAMFDEDKKYRSKK